MIKGDKKLEKFMTKLDSLEHTSKNTQEIDKLESKIESYERIARKNIHEKMFFKIIYLVLG